MPPLDFCKYPVPSFVTGYVYDHLIYSSDKVLTSSQGLSVRIDIKPEVNKVIVSANLPRMVRTITQQYTTTKHAILIPELKLTLHSKLKSTKTGFSKLVKPQAFCSEIVDPVYLKMKTRLEQMKNPIVRMPAKSVPEGYKPWFTYKVPTEHMRALKRFITQGTLPKLFSQPARVCLGYYPEIFALLAPKPITQITDTFGQIIVEFFSSDFLHTYDHGLKKLNTLTKKYIETEDKVEREKIVLRMFLC